MTMPHDPGPDFSEEGVTDLSALLFTLWFFWFIAMMVEIVVIGSSAAFVFMFTVMMGTGPLAAICYVTVMPFPTSGWGGHRRPRSLPPL
jgi:hypothetical protein